MAENPLLSAYHLLPACPDPLRPPFAVRRARRELRSRFAWAIPNQQALDLLVSCSPLVELGAGTGYWAALIAAAGGDIVAYDIAPPDEERNPYCAELCYFEVRRGDAQILESHRQRTLLLCWPPLGPMAAEALQHYRGEQVAYIGERWQGWTADSGFERELQENFELTAQVDLPCWPGCSDDLTLWQRTRRESQ